MSKPDIRMFPVDSSFDGGCNCCNSREGISKIEFGGSNVTMSVRLCFDCRDMLRAVLKEDDE